VPAYNVTIAAATAVVGFDLFTGERWARSPVDRLVTGLGMRGSAAAVDTEAELYIDEVRVGAFRNVSTGAPNMDDLFPLEALEVPAGAELQLVVTDAPATNPINPIISIEDA